MSWQEIRPWIFEVESFISHNLEVVSKRQFRALWVAKTQTNYASWWGKTICYMVPALMEQKTIVVIFSPTGIVAGPSQ